MDLIIFLQSNTMITIAASAAMPISAMFTKLGFNISHPFIGSRHRKTEVLFPKSQQLLILCRIPCQTAYMRIFTEASGRKHRPANAAIINISALQKKYNTFLIVL
jgi:hypothetical protein